MSVQLPGREPERGIGEAGVQAPFGVRIGRWLLRSVFALSSGLLLARAIIGPFRLILPVHSPLNAESVACLSFLALLWRQEIGRPRGGGENFQFRINRLDFLWLAAVVLLTGVCFLPSFTAPFLFDDYTHLTELRSWTLAGAIRPFAHTAPGVFFRPVATVLSWFAFRWAGWSAPRWHTISFGLHAANIVLIFLVARKLIKGRWPAATAAVIFALHGSRVEAVAWADARFDLLACLFSVLSFLAVLQYAESGNRRYLAASIPVAILGYLSKESAFALPIMVLAAAPLFISTTRARLIKAGLAAGALAGAAFAYRWHMLGGLGGYPAGMTTSAARSSLHASKALFHRLPALLFVPWDWAIAPERWLAASLALLLLALGIVAASAIPDRRNIGVSILITLAAALPVERLLLLDSSFAGARLLYLPVAGWGLLIGAIADGIRDARGRAAFLAVVVLFSCASLVHNLSIWVRTADSAHNACFTFGRQIEGAAGSVTVSGLPATLNGVYFLSNGFPECVQAASGFPASRLRVLSANSQPAPSFRWDPASMALVPERPVTSSEPAAPSPPSPRRPPAGRYR